MALDSKDLSDELAFRQFSAEYVIDTFTNRRTTYADWRNNLDRIDNILRGAWGVAWPDGHATFAEPHVPNIPAIAVKDRARLVAAGTPSIVCRPESTTDDAKKAAEKRERVLGGFWEMNHIRRTIAQFGADLMTAGLAAIKVLPDFSRPTAERFPIYTRIDPRHCYPGPMFTQGPEPTDMLVSYRRPWRELAKEYDVMTDLSKLLGTAARNPHTMVDFIAYYDDKDMGAFARYTREGARTSGYVWLLEPMEHKATNAAGRACCPVALTALPNPLALYEGDFDSILGALRTWNRMVAMSEDAAIDRTYLELKRTTGADVSNAGPGGEILLDDNTEVAEYMQKQGEPFSNFQLLKSIADGVRAGALLPLARTGDPNESIISAAGISAANSQMADHIRSIQRDCIAPMLEQANAIALCLDEKHADANKSIYGYAKGRAYKEDYRPSKVIDGNYRNSVVYGMGAGLDEVNTNVLILQQKNQGLISGRTAMERSPFVENPQDEERLIATENLTQAMFAGLLAQAQMGQLPAATAAAIMDDLGKGETTLQEAVSKHLIAAPLAEPQAPELPALAQGTAGAEQPIGHQGPSLARMFGGG